MSEATDDVAVKCRLCGSEDIRQRSEAFALLEVLQWQVRRGILCAIEVDDNWDAEWEAVGRGPQFECAGCGWRGGLDDLKVVIES